MKRKYRHKCRKLIASLCIFVFLYAGAFGLASCSLFGDQATPYGIWHSDDPDITLYIDPKADEVSYLYPGTYFKEGTSINIFMRMDMSKGGDMRIYKMSANTDLGILGDSEYIYFNGNITVRGDKMVYKLKPHWREETGYSKITFEKIGEYPAASTPIEIPE